MKKEIIDVPKGIHFLSDWEEFNQIFPRFPHIMNKMVTGCGFTEWAITNKFNVVLCSPRNILLDNKEAQHLGEVYRVRSSFFDKDLEVDKNMEDPKDSLSDEEIAIIANMEGSIEKNRAEGLVRVEKEMDEYFSRRNILPKKILVTYDSFHLVKEVLKRKQIFENFLIIVDEFQSIFTDSRFKSDVEMGFVDQLIDIDHLCYLSATPMMEEYLERLEDFKDLPYYELDWESLQPGRTKKPNLEIRTVRGSINEPAKDIIEKYKNGEFEVTYINTKDGELEARESREAIFYVNSVYNILNIIKKNKLKPEEVNILCADTIKNRRNIEKKLGKDYAIGHVPTREERNKMFTFCTRTVYLGADFYSDNARSFILSDANVECLAVDISLDLPQILGRQRCENNPWKDWAAFYYKPITDKKLGKLLTPEDFEAFVEMKMKKTESLIRSWDTVKANFDKDNLVEVYEREARTQYYKNNYVAVSRRGQRFMKPVVNKLVIIAEQRAFDIQQYDYKDRFTVINRVNPDFEGVAGEINAFFLEFDNIKPMYEKLRFLCEANLSGEAWEVIERRLEPRVKQYLVLGKDRIKALGYNSTKLNKEIGNYIVAKNNDKFIKKLFENFEMGQKYSKKDIKEKLQTIYDELGINKKAKATDIEEWFEVKRTYIKGKDSIFIIKSKV